MSASSFFVFVRFWPQFTQQFPYSEFNRCSDETVDAELYSKLAVEVQRRLHDPVFQARRQRAADLRDANRAALEMELFVDGFGNCVEGIDLLDRQQETPEEQFAQQAEWVGWCEGKTSCTWEGIPRLCTARVWLAATETEELTESLIAELSRQELEKSSWGFADFDNPRYAYVPTEGLSRHDRASAIAAISRLRSNEGLKPVEKYAAKNLPVIDRFLSAWAASDLQADGVLSTGAKPAETQKQLVAESAEDVRNSLIEGMPGSIRLALLAYELACRQAGKLLSCPEAHAWITHHPADSYRLPKVDTFEKYVQRARVTLGEQVNRPRAGRQGRSIVSVDQI